MNPFSAFSQRISDTINGLGYAVAGYAAIAILCAAGIGFVAAAVFMLVAEALGPIAAAAIFGFVFLLAAAIWAAVLAARARAEKRRRREAAASTATVATSVTLANTALRLVSRGGGRSILPLAAVALVGWFLLRESDD